LRQGVPTLVTASKLVAQKRVGDLVEAACQLRAGGYDFDLLLIGEGDQRSALERTAAKAIGAPFIFAGFRNQAEIPALFASSDLFVMSASRENFGLVVNEAMCAALPVVISNEVGAVRDLVRDGINGLCFPAGDVPSLADALRSLIVDPARRREMGAASRKVISGWGYDEDIAGLREALVAHAAYSAARAASARLDPKVK
jgi:glycosyltransferase involved in cell wall biosynthesis